MVYPVDTLVKEIRVALDRNNSSEKLVLSADMDTLTLDEIIKSKVAEAARIVEADAPFHLLDGGRAFATSITWDSSEGIGSGYTQLPDDFLRLLCFQMSDWSRAVFNAITPADPEYALQSSRIPGIKGTPQKPVVAIVMRPAGLTLEFYSCAAGAGVTAMYARYLPVPTVRNEEIEICEKLKPAVIYRAAYLTALTLGDAELSKNMLTASEALMR